MPNQLTWERSGFYCRCWGHVDYADMAAANQEFDEDPRSLHAKYKVIDLSDARSAKLNTFEVKQLAASNFGSSTYLPSLKVGIIARRPEIESLMLDYIELMRKLKSSWEIRLFETGSAARDWIRTRPQGEPSSHANAGSGYSVRQILELSNILGTNRKAVDVLLG